MRKHFQTLKKIFFIMFLVGYALATLCLVKILSYDHQYHLFFYVGSFFLFLYFGTYLYDWIQGPFKGFHKKGKAIE